MSPVLRDLTIQFRGRPVSGRALIATVAVAVLILITAVLVGIRQDKSPAADAALKVALSQVGTTENAAGGTKFNEWFMKSSYAKAGVARDGGSISDYANASWCDMFVTWVGAQAGVKGIGGDAFTPAHARWFQRQGRWGKAPRPGAVVFFSWNDHGIDHVGLVIKDNHDGTIRTVEGNTDHAVRIRTRSTDYVVGYGYPEYGG